VCDVVALDRGCGKTEVLHDLAFTDAGTVTDHLRPSECLAVSALDRSHPWETRTNFHETCHHTT